MSNQNSPSTVTGLPEAEQSILLNLLKYYELLVGGKGARYYAGPDRASKATGLRLIQDAEVVGSWGNVVEALGRPFEPEEKRRFISFLFTCAHAAGAMNNDDVDLVELAPNTAVRQALMAAYDIWARVPVPDRYEPGQSEAGWRGGRLAFLFDFFAFRMDPIVAQEEYTAS